MNCIYVSACHLCVYVVCNVYFRFSVAIFQTRSVLYGFLSLCVSGVTVDKLDLGCDQNSGMTVRKFLDHGAVEDTSGSTLAYSISLVSSRPLGRFGGLMMNDVVARPARFSALAPHIGVSAFNHATYCYVVVCTGVTHRWSYNRNNWTGTHAFVVVPTEGGRKSPQKKRKSQTSWPHWQSLRSH